MSAQRPEPAEGTTKVECERRVLRVQAPRQRGAQVVVLRIQLHERGQLMRAVQGRVRSVRTPQIVPRMTLAQAVDRGGVLVRTQACSGVLAHRLQKGVTRFARVLAHRDERVVDERADVAEDVPLVEDNALEGTPLADEHVPHIASYATPEAPVLSAGSFSKRAWGGLRVGWLRGPAAAVSRLAELKAMNDLGSPMLDQAIAARLVPHFDQLRTDQCRMLRHNQAFVGGLLAETLPEWTWKPPTGGPSLWIRLPFGSAASFAQVALRYGVEVIPGDVMSPDGSDGDHFRFPYTGEPPVLEETVRRLAQAWRAYAPTPLVREIRRPVVV